VQRRFIDRFEVILLDMGHTFMFNVDRFVADDDLMTTYCRIGGSRLSEGEVRRIISSVFKQMLSDYCNPDYYDHFPSVLSYLAANPEFQNLPESEIKLLEQVFARHEVGTIPDAHAEALHQLHKTHRLGVVSNIWSKSDLYWQEFVRAGIRDLFDVIIFSSDHGKIKPSPYLFAKALEAFAVDCSQIVFVGDSLRCDIAGAKAAGLSTIWIDTGEGEIDTDFASPDWVVQDLRDLIEE
jgi:HAD superfamily hydrolase (TIGR01509 family)